MKNNRKTIVVMLVLGLVFSAGLSLCRAADVNDENIWIEDDSAASQGAVASGPGKERIDKFLERLGNTDPEKAQRLQQLRKDDPEAFVAEIKDMMREHMTKGNRHDQAARAKGSQTAKDRGEFREKPQGAEFGHRGREEAKPGGRAKIDDWRDKMSRMRQMHGEYIEWLNKYYPDEAAKLEKLKGDRPELYMRQLTTGLKKYGRMFEASKDNPKLAEILKEDMQLKQKRDKLVSKIGKTDDADTKAELTGKLKDIVNQRFDLIIRRMQINYEELENRLAQLKKEVESSKNKTDELKKDKENRVSDRVTELLKKPEKLNWN